MCGDHRDLKRHHYQNPPPSSWFFQITVFEGAFVPLMYPTQWCEPFMGENKQKSVASRFKDQGKKKFRHFLTSPKSEGQ